MRGPSWRHPASIKAGYLLCGCSATKYATPVGGGCLKTTVAPTPAVVFKLFRSHYPTEGIVLIKICVNLLSVFHKCDDRVYFFSLYYFYRIDDYFVCVYLR